MAPAMSLPIAVTRDDVWRASAGKVVGLSLPPPQAATPTAAAARAVARRARAGWRLGIIGGSRGCRGAAPRLLDVRSPHRAATSPVGVWGSPGPSGGRLGL